MYFYSFFNTKYVLDEHIRLKTLTFSLKILLKKTLNIIHFQLDIGATLP